MAQHGMRWRLVGVLYAVSFVALTVSAATRWVWGVVGAVAVLAGTSLVLNWRLRNLPAESRTERILRLVVPALMVIVGAALAFWSLGALTDGAGFFGGCLLFLGIGQLLTLWRSSRYGAVARGLVLIGLCAAAFAIGLIGISSGVSVWAIVLVAVGILASPVGLSLLSEDVVQKWVLGANRNRRRALMLIGAALAAVGLGLLVFVVGVGAWYALSFGAVLALLVGVIASDTPADVLIVVAVIAVGWVIAPRGISPSEAVLPEPGETVMVALGDSYMSGEGATQFYNGTNHRRENECRRAPTAYAPEVVIRDDIAVPDDLAFVACSGAKAIEIYQQRQYRGEPIDGPVGVAADGSPTQSLNEDGTPMRGLNQLAHLGWLINDKKIGVEVVIVSVGGNDALFGEIGRTCIGPGDCSELGGRWLENLADVAPTVDRAYQEIRNNRNIGAKVPVLVVPYPVPLNAEGCKRSLLTANEHRFLHGFVGELNRVLKRAADDAGLYYLDDMRTVLEDRHLRLCDDPGNGVNFLGLNPVGGLIEQSVNPMSWFHNSLHPNERGHEVMGDTLQAWLDAHRDVSARNEPRREEGLTGIASVEDLMGPGFPHCGNPDSKLAHCDGTANDWVAAQAADDIRRSIGPLLLFIAGAWVLWLVFIGWWRRRNISARLLGFIRGVLRRLSWGGRPAREPT